MTIILDGSALTVETLVRIARHGEKVELHPEALERIKVCRGMLAEKIQTHEIMYGVNTGIGEFSEIVLDDEQVQQFQRYLIYNHAAGIGDPAPIARRAAIALPTPGDDRLLLLAEVADRLRVSVRTVRRLVDAGAIRRVRVGARLRLRESSVLGYLVARRTRRIA